MMTEKKPVVLLVDDDGNLRDMASTFFKVRGYRVDSASTYDSALRAIHNHEKDLAVAFIDINMHGAPVGLEILRYIDQMASHRMVPYAWTGNSSLKMETMCLDAGASRVFYKTHKMERLEIYARRPRVLRRLQKYIRDPITELFNFEHFTNQAKLMLTTARDRGQPTSFSLILVDLDEFKKINDVHGYLAGDEALKAFAKLLKDRLRPSDLYCRKGGDEFLVLLPGVSLGDAIIVREHLYGEKFEVKGREGQMVPIHISAGVGHLDRVDIDRRVERALATLIWRADMGRPYGLKADRERKGYKSR